MFACFSRSFSAAQEALYVRYHTAVVCSEEPHHPRTNVHNYNDHEEYL